MRFVLASNNAKKLIEMREILGALGIEVLSQRDVGVSVEPEENGTTFEENALIKARAVCKEAGIPAIADDSGLVVDALNGEPGVYSARYGGEGLDDTGRYMLLLKNLAGKENRAARFVSCIAAAFPNGDVLTAHGTCEGKILYAPEGHGGFGYDPIFFADEIEKSMGIMTSEEKNSISHRGNALREFAPKLKEYIDKKDR